MSVVAPLAPAAAVPAPQGLYRPDIDGLRAFAILAVVIYHAFPRALPGGFVGVDIFFVISGFLITGIIRRSLDAGTFTYANFYARRIKRIFPALMVVLAVSLLAGWLFLFEDEWKSISKHVFAGAFFLSNIALMQEIGYFTTAMRPLLHLWSLGIEEQFYIVWPLFLALVSRRRPALLVVIAASFALNLWYANHRIVADFYFPAMRFWELALGALLAETPEGSLNPRVQQGASLAGLLLLALSLVAINSDTTFPGAWALLPTVGAFLVIAAGPSAWFNRWVLARRPLVLIGLISYPLYLWHWPLLVFTKLFRPAGTTWPYTMAAVLTSVVLACLTYQFVETPLRHHRSNTTVPAVLAATVAIIGLIALACHSKAGPRLKTAQSERIVAEAVADWDYPFAFNFRKMNDFQTGQIPGRRDERILFVGDSHLEQYYGRIQALMAANPGRLPTAVFATQGACPPLPGVNRLAPGYVCDKFFQYAMAQAADPKIKTVVFGGYWEAYFGLGMDEDRAIRLYRIGDGRHRDWTAVALADVTFADFGTSIRSLTARGKRVYVILSNPISILYDPKKMISRLTGKIAQRDLDREDLAPLRPILDRLRAAATQAGATVIDPLPYFCDASTCRTTTDEGLPLYKDSHHMRISLASRYATFIDQVFAAPTTIVP